MICLKCGNEIKDNEQLCSNCGWNKNASEKKDNEFSTINRGVYNENPTLTKEESEEKLIHQKQFQELVEMYIGSMYYNFKKGAFSWCAFFLGPIYVAYRKHIGIAIIVYIINVLISVIFYKNLLLRTIVSLIFNLFLGLSFKKIYFESCVEKVGKIKQNNPDKGFNELTKIVKVKGGVNILYPIILMLIGGIILSTIVIMFNIPIMSTDAIEEIQKFLHNIQIGINSSNN